MSPETRDAACILDMLTHIPDATLRKVETQLQPKERTALRETLDIRRRQQAREQAPARQGKTLIVPQLCRTIQGQMEIVEQDDLIGPEGWDLNDYPAALTPGEFSTEVEAKRYETPFLWAVKQDPEGRSVSDQIKAKVAG